MMRYVKVRNAALLVGAGLGALAEAIVLRHLWQWHQMLSARVPPETAGAFRLNLAADGWLLAAAWAVTLAGVLALWLAVRGPGRLPQTRTLLGYLFVGWGAFVVAEAVVAHHVLELHHVRDFPVHMAFYDGVYVILGGALALFGLALRDGKDWGPAPLGERRSGRERRLAA